MTSMDAPIGVFDSGIGGLTVAHEIIKKMPGESIIYLGDTARVPYGTRDSQTITKFATELFKFLLKEKVKALVVACNTISATCLEVVKKISPVPVIDVITPMVEYVAQEAAGKNIGVIGTRATINSKAYDKAFEELGIKISSLACPLFVPLIEEGALDSPATLIIAESYLKDFRVDALVLGCTHYPLLKNVIRQTVGRDVLIFDSAKPTANALLELLLDKKLISAKKKSTYKFYVTDDTEKTEEVANLFFENNLPVSLEKISL